MARPRDTARTRRGRDRLEKLFEPAVTVLDNILNGKDVDLQEKRKTAQYVIDHNIGRAAFQVYGQVDLYRTELILKAFLAGDPSLLPDAECQVLTEYMSGQVPEVPQEDVHSELPTAIEPAVSNEPEPGQDSS